MTLKIIARFQNLGSDDAFEGVTIFNDDVVCYNSEKHLVFHKGGKTIDESYKALPHGACLEHGQIISESDAHGDGAEDFTEKIMLDWLKAMGTGAVICRNGLEIRLE